MASCLFAALFCFCLSVCIVNVTCQPLQKKINPADMGVLQVLYDRTGGSAGLWNYNEMEKCVAKNKYSPLLIGRPWNFTKAANGAYIEEPCPVASANPLRMQSFMGINCTCDTAEVCSVNALAVMCGNLQGTIPAEIGLLKHLTFLELSENSFRSVPEDLYKLTNLRYLDLDNNSIQSTISSLIGSLTKMEHLFLYQNSFFGPIPEVIGLLSNLIYFDFSDNALTSVLPNSLGDLRNLEIIFVDRNFISGTIPASIENLKSLTYFSILSNDMSGIIPEELWTLSQLSVLDLGKNNFFPQGLSPKIGQLQQLQLLSLQDNAFTGRIPASVGLLTLLQVLDLSRNLFSFVPDELSNLINLKTMLLQNNLIGSQQLSFINPAHQRNLSLIDLSSNGLTGPLPPALFTFPALETLALGSNCFSSTLPATICSAENLSILGISGLSSGAPCRRYYWNKRISNVFGFDGFGAKYFMQGSLPSCVYSLPRLTVLSAAGNAFHGKGPQLVSSSLQQIDLSRNKLTGSIPKDISAAMLTGGSLKFLNLSHNRISGNLSTFSADIAITTVLNLVVNRISGVVPQSLHSVREISILTGNVIDCSAGRTELPESDVGSYQCGSSFMNRMLYGFVAVISALVLIWESIFHRSSLRYIYRTLRLWLATSAGERPISGISPEEFNFTQIARYYRSTQDLRRLAFAISLAGGAILIIYLALSGERARLIQDSYLWVTTAAFLKGKASVFWLLMIGITTSTLISGLIIQNIRQAKATTAATAAAAVRGTSTKHRENISNYHKSKWPRYTWPIIRGLILVLVVLGVIIGGNIWYLRILLRGSRRTQEIFKLFFAAFKLIWTSQVIPAAFASEKLLFGLKKKHHDSFLLYWFGGEINLMIILNSVSTFGVPLLAITFEKDDCFHDVFVSSTEAKLQFSINDCAEFYPDGSCAFHEKIPILSNLQMPFLYNYSCSSAMIRTYIPLFLQMFMLLILLSAMQFLYLCWDISVSVSEVQPNKVDSYWNRFWIAIRSAILMTMPTKHLLYNSKRRHERINAGKTISEKRNTWIMSRTPARFSNLLVLLTFGIWAPLLAFVIALSMCLETYITELVMGRFLVTELGIVQQCKCELGLFTPDNPGLEMLLSPQRRAHMTEDFDDVDKPWGALDALKSVQEQCQLLPASSLAQGRAALVIIPSFTMAFLLLDVSNTDNTKTATIYWPSIAIISFSCGLELLALVYKQCKIRQGVKADSSAQVAKLTQIELQEIYAKISRDSIQLSTSPMHEASLLDKL